MDASRLQRLRNEVVNFVTEKCHRTFDCDVTAFGDDICSLVREACSTLDSPCLRLTLLDNLIRRKSDLFLPFIITSDIVVELLVSDFVSLVRDLQTGRSSVLTELCLCAQLLSFCISKSKANIKTIFESLFVPLKCLLLTSTAIDGLIACSTLIITIVKHQDASICTELFASFLQDSLIPDLYRHLPYFELIKDLLLDNQRQVVQLSLIHAFLGMSSDLWSVDPTSDTTLAVLILNFCFPRGSRARAYSTLEMPVLLFLAKIGQIWSARYRDCGTAYEQETIELFSFSLELKGSPVAVIRHACLDICTNLLMVHFKGCQSCVTKGYSAAPCNELQKSLCSMAASHWYAQGTLALLSRAISTIFDRTGHRASWIIQCLALVCFKQEKPTENTLYSRSVQVVTSELLRCASVPSLGVYVSDLYVRIAVRLSTEDSDSLCQWFDVLVRLSNEEFQEYSAFIKQYLLPKLATANANFIVQLLDHPLPVGHTMALPLRLACYQVLLSPEASAKCRKQAEQIAVHRDVMLSALTVYDSQLRLGAFELLLVLIKGCHDREKLIDYMELFLHFLKYNMWIYERPVRRQIVAGVAVVCKRLWDARNKLHTKEPTPNPDCVELFLTRLAVLLLQSLYPGVPAPRMNFALSALYTLVLALTQFDCDIGPQIHPTGWDILLRAVQLSETPFPMCLYDGVVSSVDHPPGRRCSVIESLSARLYLGLYSPYEEDREYALQIMLITNLASQLGDELRSSLWFRAVTRYAESAKPDISPLAWNLLRLAVNDRARLESDRCPHQALSFEHPTESTLQSLANPTERVCVTVRYLISSVMRCIRLAELNPIKGLLDVSGTKPFYAMLSAVRALFSQFEAIAIDPKVQQKSISVIRFDKPLCASCIFRPLDSSWSVSDGNLCSIADHLIDIALRISDLILPVLSHASPEGFVPDHEDDAYEEPTEVLSNHIEQVRQYPEYLNICCWRSVRELSVLLGCYLPRAGNVLLRTERGPLVNLTNVTALGLSHSQLLRIGEFFCSQLLCGRHMGAVEQCSAGFSPFCQALLSSEDIVVKQLPVLWLETVLNNLLDGVGADVSVSSEASFLERARWLPVTCLARLDQGYCTTRRSAGLPLFVQDILGAVWTVNGKDGALTVSTVERLLDVIEQTFKRGANSEMSLPEPPDGSNSSVQRCVVALNLTRALIRSSILMQPTAEFIERATCLAIDGLGSEQWALRNSSGLLFSTLMERLFGVNRSRDVTSRKNCLSSANFFKLYPNLKAHLVRTLEDTTSDLNTPNLRRTRLYSSLLILTRLLPPTQQSAITGLVGSTFGPFVLKCAASCDIRIRQLAARALLSLVQVNQLAKVTSRYIAQLHTLVHDKPIQRGSFSRSNLVHGLLLQLQQLLAADNWTIEDHTMEADRGPPVGTRDALIEQFSKSLDCLADPKTTVCPVIRKTYLAILGNRGPRSDRWNAACLNRPGLELEASEECVRLFVGAWFAEARGKFVLSNDAHSPTKPNSVPIIEFVKQLHSPPCRSLFFREMLLELQSGLSQFTPNDPPRLVRLIDKREANDQFIQFLTAQLDFTELLHFLRTMDPHGIERTEAIRYGTQVLIALTDDAKCDPSVLDTVLDWAESLSTSVSRSEQFVATVCLPPILLLTVALIARLPTDCKLCLSNVSRMTQVLTNSVRLSTISELDVGALSQALLRVIATLPFDFGVLLYKTSCEPLIFLLENLLNYGQPGLQETACDACQHFVSVDKSTTTSTGFPQPYAILGQTLTHLIRKYDFDLHTLVHGVLVPLLRRISVSPSTVQKNIRVFAHGSEDRLFDLVRTMDTIVDVLIENDPRRGTSESPQPTWITFRTRTDHWWFQQVRTSVDYESIETRDRLRDELGSRYLEFLESTWPI